MRPTWLQLRQQRLAMLEAVSKRASMIEADDRGGKARGYSGERKDVHTDNISLHNIRQTAVSRNARSSLSTNSSEHLSACVKCLLVYLTFLQYRQAMESRQHDTTATATKALHATVTKYAKARTMIVY